MVKGILQKKTVFFSVKKNEPCESCSAYFFGRENQINPREKFSIFGRENELRP